MSLTFRLPFVVSRHALLLLALLSSTSAARAGLIDASGGAVGPGLGQANVVELATPNANNGPNAANPGNPINIDKRFDQVAPIDMTFHVSNTTGTTSYFVDETVTNNTGVPWTDYHIELGFGTGAAFVQSTGQLDFYPPSTSDAFATLAQGAYTIDWSNGSIPAFPAAGSVSRQFTFHINVPDLAGSLAPQEYWDLGNGGYEFTLRQYPTIPEPATFVLAALGCIGLAAGAWRKRR